MITKMIQNMIQEKQPVKQPNCLQQMADNKVNSKRPVIKQKQTAFVQSPGRKIEIQDNSTNTPSSTPKNQPETPTSTNGTPILDKPPTHPNSTTPQNIGNGSYALLGTIFFL